MAAATADPAEIAAIEAEWEDAVEQWKGDVQPVKYEFGRRAIIDSHQPIDPVMGQKHQVTVYRLLTEKEKAEAKEHPDDWFQYWWHEPEVKCYYENWTKAQIDAELFGK